MKLTLLIISFVFTINSIAQQIPSKVENIPYLVTFGKQGSKAHGDDDFSQVIFISIPKSYTKPFYLRLFDPEVSGQLDENIGDFNTRTSFQIFGGKGCYSNKDAKNINPVGNYKSGNLLKSKSFGNTTTYDNKWYTFGPFNPSQGEFAPDFNSTVFKIVVSGISGNDGNLYKFFISTSKTQNQEVEGANFFAYEYTFRLHSDPNQVAHVYPFVDSTVVAIIQQNFDWDNDGYIQLYSSKTYAKNLSASADNAWAKSKYIIKKGEQNKSIDIRFTKRKGSKESKNNVVFYITNQYGEHMPFFVMPLGGVPKYKAKISVKKSNK